MSIPPVNIPLLALTAVFLAIAVRQIGSLRVQIWQAMLLGAVVVLVTESISVASALQSISLDVMVFLFGMFVVGQALEESGYLAHISYRFFKRAQSRDRLLLMILFGAGVASAFLMNDTLAIIGTPVVLLIARKHGMSPKLLLLALAFAVTIGSVMSPIGNPQNLLIALHGGLQNPFGSFLRWLLLPTVLNMVIAYYMLRWFYQDDFREAELSHSQEPIHDHDLALLSRVSLGIIIVLVVVKIITAIAGIAEGFHLTHIAIAACLPVLLGSKRRWRVLRGIDWHTLVFFAAMFVLMESVWQSGFFQTALAGLGINLAAPEMILTVSVVLSQFISNVPLVALFQPVLLQAGAGMPEMMALAAGSTIAGNLFVLGAASNVIIIQNAEKKAGQSVTFLEFARVGIPLTIINTFVYWIFLRFL